MADVDPSVAGYEEPDPNRPASASPAEGEIEAEAVGNAARHDPYAALRFPAYRLFSIGWMAAVMGSQMTAAALGWEIAQRSDRPEEALAQLAGIQVIPLVFLALPAGVIADRFDRRRLIQITAALNALCSVGLAILSYRTGSVPWMYACVIASATALTLGRPARSALLPNIVPAAVFTNAVTWNSSMFQTSSMVGAAIGGLLIDLSLRWFGSLSLPYLFDASCALLYAVLIFWIPRPPAPVAPPGDAPGMMEQLSAGIEFVYSTKIIFATLTLDLFAVLLGGVVYILPLFAQNILHVGGFEFGCMKAADAVGAFAMSLVLAHLPPMKRAGRAMLLAVGLFGVCTILFGLSRSYWWSLALLFVIGAVDIVSVVIRHTLVQVLTPDHMRGRVSAVNNVFIGASNELGGFESGLTASWFGPVASAVIGGIGTLITVGVTALAFPQLRKYGPLQPHAGPQTTLKGRGGSSSEKSSASEDTENTKR